MVFELLEGMMLVVSSFSAMIGLSHYLHLCMMLVVTCCPGVFVYVSDDCGRALSRNCPERILLTVSWLRLLDHWEGNRTQPIYIYICVYTHIMCHVYIPIV